MADEATKDKLGLAQEFEEVPPAPPAEEKPVAQEPQKWMREIDVGGRKQKFEADTYEGLIEKLVEAQVNATRKLQELSIERKKHEPEKRSSDWQELKPNHTADPAANDPQDINRFRRIFAAEVGLTPEEFRQAENERRRIAAERAAENDFLRTHQDYNPVPENAQRMYRFLQEQNLPLSKHNLDYAYQELREQLVGKIAQPQVEPIPPKAEPAAPPSRIPSPPTFVRPSLGGRGEMMAEGEIDAAEVARIAQLPPAEMKARIEYYHRQSRTSR